MSGRIVGSVCAAAITAAAALVPAVPAAQASATPSRPADRSVSELLTQLKTLYRKAEEATEAYNATEEKLRKQRARTRELTAELVRTRTELADSHDDAGRLARRQYQGHSALSPYSFLLTLLAPHPENAADEARELERAAGREAALVERLTKGERHADTVATRARTALDKQLSLASKRKKQRDKVKKRLDTIEKLLAALSARQIAQVAQRERQETAKAQRKLIDSGALGTTGAAASQGAAGSPAAPTDSGNGAGSGTGTAPATGATTAPGSGQDAPAAPVPTPEATGTAPRPPRQSPGRPGTASADAGRRALAYALNQIGKPYVWGAEGPDSFDCSGLTSTAWAHAGRVIPRTSQEQWRQLPRVPISQLRPGDLVIYYKGASHVAMYAGNGQVVQAPRPGQRVKLSPLASNPIQGAVRPGRR
ncbi:MULTISPECIES: C40 family peptidase [Streptomyces]|uniref:Cell wall-associated NlpC family hydrolase n=1 Tax=Streptomyces demainii TaxID=588122 RepID=A0ABT9KYH8_9ACTN|nr:MULTISPECIES: C40 family peptidase [Streptomyces]MBW8087460.1 C40 family peptidase [Streptomyces hygroscopicus subsp. hygroscopicus]MDP9613493.1 cell wall-associated NlpC family hydrolase [Streptomyces demainii]